MKLNTLFLFLFLIVSITSEDSLESYSIEPFKEYLIKEGLFEIIKSIKEKYDQDIAIISCEELTESRKGNCKRLVTDYMGPSTHPEIKSKTRTPEEETIICIEKLTSQILEQSNIKLNLKRILRKKLTKKNSNIIYNKIIERVTVLPPCEELS